jgi:hypothetical protein
MRVKTQIATAPTAAIKITSSATAPPFTPLLALRVANVVDVDASSTVVVVLRRVVVELTAVVVVAAVVDVVARAVVVVVVAFAVVVVGFTVVVGASVVVVSSAARAPTTPDVSAAIAPIVASRRSARRTYD